MYYVHPDVNRVLKEKDFTSVVTAYELGGGIRKNIDKTMAIPYGTGYKIIYKHQCTSYKTLKDAKFQLINNKLS